MEAELEYLRRKVEQLESMILFIQAEVHEKLAVGLEGFFKHKAANVAEQKQALQLEENMYLKLLDNCTSAVDNCNRFKNGSTSNSDSGPGKSKVNVNARPITITTPVTPTSTDRRKCQGRVRVRNKNFAPEPGQKSGCGKRKHCVSNSDQDSSSNGYENEADQSGICSSQMLGLDPISGTLDTEDGFDYNEIKTEIPDSENPDDDDAEVDANDQTQLPIRNRKRSSYTADMKLKVVQFAKANGNASAAREYDVHRKCVIQWKKLEDSFKEQVEGRNPKKKRLTGGGRKPDMKI